jgi:hypothetical protein
MKTTEASHCLEEYRGFRHIVRNVYTFNLRPARLEELTSGLRYCYQLVMRDLEGFCIFLDKVSVADEAD